MLLLGINTIHSQTSTIEGSCGDDMKWTFDGITLTISTNNKATGAKFFKPMDDYGLEKNISPWRKKKLDIKKIVLGAGVTSIGSCAFAECNNLTDVLFEGTEVKCIGWGAFLNCTRLHTITLPNNLNLIEKIAFANCRSLNHIKIPAKCRVEDQAFVSCDNLQSIECSPTAVLGQLVFAKEVYENGELQHIPYSGEIRQIPPYINTNNCLQYGLGKESVKKLRIGGKAMEEDYDKLTSILDSKIPNSGNKRDDTYVLIIGNQNYRFAPDVSYAIHDARIFGEYCKFTLGIPLGNIHIAENATKHMIMEEELTEWLDSLQNRQDKQLIVYYAGHGVPDIEEKRSYLLPTDVRGTHPKHGIALDELYAIIGKKGFKQTTIFLDACFSGITRDNESVTEGERGVEYYVDETPLNEGNLVVFSAAQGNETAQGYPEEGHGLFTYYLLKELRETYGSIKFGRLADNIKNGVSEKAKSMKLRKKQTPNTSYSNSLKNSWRDLSF